MRAAAAAAAAPLMRRHAEAVLDRPGRRVAGGVTLLPAERFRALLEVVAPRAARRRRRQVLDAELDRIHADAIGELVHQDFGEEASLRMTRRAHRALLARVDVDVGVLRAGGSGTGRCTAAGSLTPRPRRPCPSSGRRTP